MPPFIPIDQWEDCSELFFVESDLVVGSLVTLCVEQAADLADLLVAAAEAASVCEAELYAPSGLQDAVLVEAALAVLDGAARRADKRQQARGPMAEQRRREQHRVKSGGEPSSLLNHVVAICILHPRWRCVCCRAVG